MIRCPGPPPAASGLAEGRVRWFGAAAMGPGVGGKQFQSGSHLLRTDFQFTNLEGTWKDQVVDAIYAPELPMGSAEARCRAVTTSFLAYSHFLHSLSPESMGFGSRLLSSVLHLPCHPLFWGSQVTAGP